MFKLQPFQERLKKKVAQTLLKKIEDEILANLEVGNLIPGLAGLRKMRVADPSRQKGKRGGLRVLYIDLASVQKTNLIYLYGKDEAEDLTQAEKKIFRSLVEQIKGEKQ